ncbi:GNAT family N-acetyltransferase [Streptomyces mayteni]
MDERVALRPMDEENLAALLATAVADAPPEDVMPPVAGPAGWTADRREAFLAWHRARLAGLDGPAGEAAYAVADGGLVVGSVRLARAGGPDVLETGIWLGRSRRGRGIGTAALRLLCAEARRAGGRLLVADTTADNGAAVAILRRLGATLCRHPDGVAVHATLPLR